MRTAVKLASSIVLLAVAAYCGFGFLSSPEADPDYVGTFRLIFGFGALACVASVAAIWLAKGRSGGAPPRPTDLSTPRPPTSPDTR